jgi:hypothetical protein
LTENLKEGEAKMKTRVVFIVFVLLALLTVPASVSASPVAGDNGEYGPRYDIVSNNVVKDGEVIIPFNGRTFPVQVSYGTEEVFEITYRYCDGNQAREYHVLYRLLEDGIPSSWNASKSDVVWDFKLCAPYRGVLV